MTSRKYLFVGGPENGQYIETDLEDFVRITTQLYRKRNYKHVDKGPIWYYAPVGWDEDTSMKKVKQIHKEKRRGT